MDDQGGYDPETYASVRGITLEQARAELGVNTQPNTGHNAGPAPAWAPRGGAGITSPDAAALTQAAKDKLKSVVARVEQLEEEKKEVAGQIKDVYAEAKSMGYDTSAIRTLIREKKQDPQERAEREAILDVYRLALDMAD